MRFLDGLDTDLRNALLGQLKSLWTHGSTALEGNTLTLGETDFVIREGLTVQGKSLGEHEQVVGHAKAIDQIYALLEKDELEQQDLFALHRAVQTSVVTDVYAPVGAWKREPNGTYALTPDNQRVFIEFVEPRYVAVAMEQWFSFANRLMGEMIRKEAVPAAFAQLHLSSVHIHPFHDGNGRMARLVANLPVLRNGFPPILIPKEKRKEYLQLLSTYQQEVPVPSNEQPILPDLEKTKDFAGFCRECWEDTLQLVQDMHRRQAERDFRQREDK